MMLTELDLRIIARVQGYKGLTAKQIANFEFLGCDGRARRRLERLVMLGYLLITPSDKFIWSGKEVKLENEAQCSSK